MRVHTTVRGLYSMYLLVLPTCKFTTRVAPSRLGGLLSLLDCWLGSCETQKRVRIDCFRNRPSLRIKREAHLKSAERRDTCGEPLSGDTELSI
jgi:hypothetical protein